MQIISIETYYTDQATNVHQEVRVFMESGKITYPEVCCVHCFAVNLLKKAKALTALPNKLTHSYLLGLVS